MRRLRFDELALPRHRPAQKWRIHQIGTNERDDRAEHPAKTKLAQWLGLDDEQTGKA